MKFRGKGAVVPPSYARRMGAIRIRVLGIRSVIKNEVLAVIFKVFSVFLRVNYPFGGRSSLKQLKTSLFFFDEGNGAKGLKSMFFLEMVKRGNGRRTNYHLEQEI